MLTQNYYSDSATWVAPGFSRVIRKKDKSRARFSVLDKEPIHGS